MLNPHALLRLSRRCRSLFVAHASSAHTYTRTHGIPIPIMSHCKIVASYPEVAAGEKRIIFALDPKGDKAEQEQYMLQLIPGRVLEMSHNDAANLPMLSGSIEQHTVEDGDAVFFRVKLEKQLPSTLMHIHDEDDNEKVRQFVGMANTPMFPYTSRYPVVVYLPNDAALHYCIWCGGHQMQAATE
ncbi:ecotin, putative [Leishmania tarentolae]|uniref:Ecotin, putative n=1 Tax=Leishmania tarentolae TaxID=5689 RepID=A0A640KD45_LEITA|nr:ecotin, putative [Leishmania tarentolae]